MGLDITAVSQIEFLQSDNEEEWEGTVGVYPNEHFPLQGEGLKPGLYAYKERLGFRAGSYSGYNDWRNFLAMLTGTNAQSIHAQSQDITQNLPFGQLINFSDCDGVIGPKTSAKLAKDFVEWRDRAAIFAKELGSPGYDYVEYFFLEKYHLWQKAFEMAADNGAVLFH